MARGKAPYWVRWVGQDATALTLRLQAEVDRIIEGLLSGDRRDETVRKLHGLKAILQELKDDTLVRLQETEPLDMLIKRVLKDDYTRLVIKAALEQEE